MMMMMMMMMNTEQSFYYTVELQWLRHRWLVYHGCFELILESLGKNLLAADIIIRWIIYDGFLFYIDNGMFCVPYLSGYKTGFLFL